MKRRRRIPREPIENTLRDLLASERRRRNHSQAWLAEKLGLVGKTSVSRVETGGTNMSLAYFISACRVMNINAGVLLERAEHVDLQRPNRVAEAATVP